MINFLKNVLNSTLSTQAAAPVVQATAKAKAPRKPKTTKGVSDIQKARDKRMAGWSLSGMDKAQTEAFGPAFEAVIHAFAKKESEANDSMRTVSVKLNVMLSKPGDNAHWSLTMDENRIKVNAVVRERFFAKYREVKVARNGLPPTRNTVRGLYNKIIALSLQEAGYTEKTNETGTGNAKDYATFALENATTAYKRGYRIHADKRDATDTSAMESYGSIIIAYKGEAGLKAVQKAVNDAAKPKGKGKASAAKGKGPTRKPSTTARASYPRRTKV